MRECEIRQKKAKDSREAEQTKNIDGGRKSQRKRTKVKMKKAGEAWLETEIKTVRREVSGTV